MHPLSTMWLYVYYIKCRISNEVIVLSSEFIFKYRLPQCCLDAQSYYQCYYSVTGAKILGTWAQQCGNAWTGGTGYLQCILDYRGYTCSFLGEKHVVAVHRLAQNAFHVSELSPQSSENWEIISEHFLQPYDRCKSWYFIYA